MFRIRPFIPTPLAITAIRSTLVVLAFILFTVGSNAQPLDTTVVHELRAAEVMAPVDRRARPMADTVGALIMAGKRTTMIDPGAQQADLSVNAARQVFAKVPGISVWESDGSGAQLGIAARGLSPNRSWEFNMRQNGHDICADVFGYPEAYYTPPMEAVDRIEVVRGGASLAFGPQFGGAVNFLLKRGATDRPLSFETRQTLGAFGAMNTYNALGGTKGRWNYYSYLHHRSADGWRENGRYTTTTAYGAVEYRASTKWKLGAQFTRMDLRGQQPGGLSDAVFGVSPRSSSRQRNWLLLPWHTGALTAEFRDGARTIIDMKLFGTASERNSVGFLKGINQPDTMDRSTGAYAARQVDRDAYMNVGLEARLRRGWRFHGRDAQLAIGIRAYGASTHRRQQGTGSTGSDADIAAEAFKRELDLTTRNGAFHVENMFQLSERLSVTPGARVEHIVSRVDGRINSSGSGAVDSGERQRNRALFGMGAQWKATSRASVHANFSEAYRPVLYSDLTPSATTDVIDPELKDAAGYNIDLGYRGELNKVITFDIGVYYLRYDNRIGSVLRDGANYRTNIGTSVSTGVEAYAEADVLRLFHVGQQDRRISVFGAYGLNEARYTRWNDPALAEDPLKRIADKRVEYAPRWNFRGGLTWSERRLTTSVLVSTVDGVYTDAANTEKPNEAATVGWIPGYTLLDANATWSFTKQVHLTVGVNNVTDEVYATRRAGGYPGPGLLPGTGRAWYLTLAARF
jgi:Fe(3+) dicitrate transport protein